MKSASEKASSMTASTDDAENDVDNDLRGVDVRTSTADIKSTLDDGTFYVMGKVGDNFGFFQYTAQYMPAHKAYLLLDGSTVLAPGLKMVFGETTPLLSPEGEKGASPRGGLVHAERHSPDARGQDSAAPHHLRQPRRPVEHADVQQ